MIKKIISECILTVKFNLCKISIDDEASRKLKIEAEAAKLAQFVVEEEAGTIIKKHSYHKQVINVHA